MQIAIQDFPMSTSPIPTAIMAPPRPPLPSPECSSSQPPSETVIPLLPPRNQWRWECAPNTNTPTVRRMEVDDGDNIYENTVKCFLLISYISSISYITLSELVIYV